MRTLRLIILTVLGIVFALSSTAQRRYLNVHVGNKILSYPLSSLDSLSFSDDIPQGALLSAPRITKVTAMPEQKATVYNIEYPSTDPYGNPAMLSGAIIIDDNIINDKHARGMVLYNHFTVYGRHQVPSMGDVGIPLKVVGSKMIAIAADYYGFGSTDSANQAYCMSRVNAQASVDALLAARQLLKEMGYTWDDFLFNMGYSEGGQTAMAVLRLCTERYPDIHFTHTIAGGGPYDIGETYRQLVASGETSMPSTVISTLLAYNEYCRLGYTKSDLFKGATIDKIDEYLLSKNYVQKDIETNIATPYIRDWLVEPLFDFESAISKRFMEVFEKDNLSKGWTPRPQERISLVHNKLDKCVPYANTTQMEQFFKKQGFTVTETPSLRFKDGTVFSNCGNWDVTVIAPEMGQHEFGALPFIVEIMDVVCHYLEISPWFTITAADLQSMFS